MKTLIVNSYDPEFREKIEPVCRLVSEFSECVVEWDCVLTRQYDLSQYDAIVLSGSPRLISRGEYNQGYLIFLREMKLPTLGICYGHQLLAHAFGARVRSGDEFIDGDRPVRILKFDPLFVGLPEAITVHESHREYVMPDDLRPCGLELLAESESCPVEAFGHIKRPLFGVQFHLERSGEVGRSIMQNFYRVVRD